MLGRIEFENFEGLTSMPQEYASAWTAAEGIIGASYKPLICVGKQAAKGTNYWFIAEQTLVTREPIKHIVSIAVNGFNGVYAVVPDSINILIA